MGRGTFKMCNFSFTLFPWFLLALVSFHLSLFLSLTLLPEQRVLQRDQAGLAYWKQMADQRQEGHGFMKRASNMPGSCRGAWPWMTAARCEWECACVKVSILCIAVIFFLVISSTLRWYVASKIWWFLKPLTPGVLLQYEIANQRLMPGIHQIWAKRWRVQ